MENKTLRLIYPQWQGGIVDHWMPELPPDDASRGYYLGSHLLNFLAPGTGQQTAEVPVSLDIGDREEVNGVSAHRVILEQTKAALKIVREHRPGRIVTLGGDCAVSVVPFTYLESLYPEDVALIWIDAHPDITLPGDAYAGYHAMALTACLGMGDPEITGALPARFQASKALVVGLRHFEPGEPERMVELGLSYLAPAAVAENSETVTDWIKGTGASKVAIHFDMDVLDPQEMIAAVGVVPQGMKIAEVVRVINDIHAQYDIVGLTVAEPMPRIAIRIKNMLGQLPLLED